MKRLLVVIPVALALFGCGDKVDPADERVTIKQMHDKTCAVVYRSITSGENFKKVDDYRDNRENMMYGIEWYARYC